MSEYAADLAAVRAAAARIEQHAHQTPLLHSTTLDTLAGRRLLLKCENLQKTGSFKFRGALNAVRQLPPDAASRGVVTHSSGNFAQALALAAKLAGVPAHIVMPSNAPAVKQAAVAGYGGRIILCEPTLPARTSAAAKVVAETGGTLLHPYDHADVIAGQGTIALELLAQEPELDAIIVPVGGGGLISGIALAARELKPDLVVLGAEPLGADDAARSKAAGRLIPQRGPDTIADGLLTSLGQLTWPVVRDVVPEILVVDDDAIAAAMKLLYERCKLVVEASGAVALAAALSAEFRARTGLERVALVLSGGNQDLGRLPFVERA